MSHFKDLPLYIEKLGIQSKVLFSVNIEVSKHLSKKNSNKIKFNMKTRKRYIGMDDKARLLQDDLVSHFRAVANYYGVNEPLSCKLWLLARFHYPKNKNGSPCEKISDLSNLLQGPEDALQKAKVIVNDKQIQSFDGSRIINDSDSTRLEIYLMEFEQC